MDFALAAVPTMNPQDMVIETARLILRPVTAADLDGFAAFAADPAAMRFMGGVAPRPVAWRAMMVMAGCWAQDGFAMFSVIEKTSGQWIGRIGPWRPEGWPGTEIGWGLLPAWHGRGYATEAAAASMDFAVERLGWTDIIHTIDPENTASIAVARRLGSRNRGPGALPAPYEAARIDIWGQTAAEWRATRGRFGL
jgi:RimJ/RimL family protein N-acetyltransferase